MGVRSNSEILKGSALMLFFQPTGATAPQPVGFATEHSVEINMETIDIQTKDHGDFGSVLPQRLTWSGSATNLVSDAGEAYYMNLIKNKTPLKIVFAKAAEYSPAGYGEGTESGIVGANGSDTDWTPATGVMAEGQAYITNFSINASSGDQATMTIQFTGDGAFGDEN